MQGMIASYSWQAHREPPLQCTSAHWQEVECADLHWGAYVCMRVQELRWADAVSFMDRGQILFTGSPAEMEVYMRRLGALV